MFEALFRGIFGLLFGLLCWLVLIPVGFVLATPVIFFFVLFRSEGTFKDNVSEEYQKLWKFWKSWGVLMMPPW
jgi:hypothetical protein